MILYIGKGHCRVSKWFDTHISITALIQSPHPYFYPVPLTPRAEKFTSDMLSGDQIWLSSTVLRCRSIKSLPFRRREEHVAYGEGRMVEEFWNGCEPIVLENRGSPRYVMLNDHILSPRDRTHAGRA
jgi:hypothetical protein